MISTLLDNKAITLYELTRKNVYNDINEYAQSMIDELVEKIIEIQSLNASKMPEKKENYNKLCEEQKLEMNKLESELTIINDNINERKDELSKLGFFSFSKKKTVNNAIVKLENDKNDVIVKKQEASKKYSQKIENLKMAMDNIDIS